MVTTYLLAFLVALAVSAAITPLVERTAVRVDILDRPGGRKLHASPVPRVGGVGVALGLAAALGACVMFDAHAGIGTAGLEGLLPTISGALLIFAVGLWDDIDPLSPALKLVAQVAAAAIVVGAGIGITRVTVLGTTYDLGAAGPLLTACWIVGITNAFNLLDGLDGLAGGLVTIAGATCATVLIARGEHVGARLLVALVGATVGFLAYNLHPARIFLGDAGSLLAGFLLSVTAITGQQKGATTLAAGVPLLIFALPIADTGLAILRRVVLGQRDSAPGMRSRLRALGRVVRPDSDHLHHRLRKAGLPPTQTVIVLYLLACLFSATALYFMEVP
ncbi:putative undecaprenyl-phosphate N-acetylglucosaminyl 1-phosphate transferase [Luteitalea sp. TBR-22]|uniref:glycosyltransferase family 4 protein n=1 Tax=Luteitalea sp. TBR-22 TaxID=2802971 RepID=UPI001AF2AB17|nr:MraY family glycosyltransferase [Luteitalea sp. TBR-22]BCS35508.1 putative undecaprenyl-phosphate N-acetylglucosaminyl 1-phosphate transferase [Luteitalea sp. TBR-22]